MTTDLKAPVYACTRTVGSNFGTRGVVLNKRGGVIATCENVRPFGFERSALLDAMRLASDLGFSDIAERVSVRA